VFQKSKAPSTYKNLLQFLSKRALGFLCVAISTAKEFCTLGSNPMLLLLFCFVADLCVFWVSSLAYPNSLGTKGYVVVVDDDTSHFSEASSVCYLGAMLCGLVCMLDMSTAK